MSNVHSAFGAIVLTVVSGACGASNPVQRARGTPDLASAMPAPTGSPFGLANGHRYPQLAARAQAPAASREADLRRGPVAPGATASGTSSLKLARVERARPSAQLLTGSKVQASLAPEPAGDLSTASGTLLHASAEQPSAVSDSQRYAQRQNQSRNLERYRGGDVVVIGVSTLVIVLLIVLLIVILL